MRLIELKMKGGAVMVDRSPLKEASDFQLRQHLHRKTCDPEHGRYSRTFKKEVHDPLDCGGTEEPSSLEDMPRFPDNTEGWSES